MKLIIYTTFCFFLISCNSSKYDYPSDFSANYILKSELMRYELTINISGDVLTLNYKNEQDKRSGNGVYTIKDIEINNLYKYSKSISILTMKAPENERLLDAPQQSLKVTYGNQSNNIDFGSVKNPPENIVKLKAMIIDLAAIYNKSFKHDLGLD
jgi:hypothetical protein